MIRNIDLKPQYDLVVVGGGIQGCAMFWEAQSRGLNTLLVEAQDYCSQTSANSMKTIHGGIRYLQTLNLPRTWQSCKEPEYLLRIAPHLVQPLPFMLPTQDSLKRSRLAVSTGFCFYNMIKKLACPQAVLPKARGLSKAQLGQYISGLNHQSVTGAGLWYDAQVTHAERFGLAFIKSGQQLTGQAYNYLKADSVAKNKDQLYEINMSDQISLRPYQTQAESVVFCTAVNTTENLSGHVLDQNKLPEFCLAINLVVNKRYHDVALGLPSGFKTGHSDDAGRLLFSAPWKSSTLFGTWYFDANELADNQIRVSDEQFSFCLQDINNTYPGITISQQDVVMVHAGLLPIDQGNHNGSGLMLKEQDMVLNLDSSARLLAVIPSKYTTCRVTAEKTIDRLSKHMSKQLSHSVSANTALMGAQLNYSHEQFLKDCQRKYEPMFPTPVINQLATNYGQEIEILVALCHKDNSLSELIPGSRDHIKAQIDFAVDHEQAVKITDIFKRRTSLYSVQRLQYDTIEYVSDRLINVHGWDPIQVQ